MDDIKTIPVDLLAKLFNCGICKGLVVEAVSLPECHHVFCKSCIVMHCYKLPAVCPFADCGAEIHATKPQTCLKNDTDLQTLINKLFVDVYLDEMHRRREFFDHYISQRDASMYQYSGEQIGIPLSRDWLRPIPKMMQVTLQYDVDLEQNELCFRPSRVCTKPHTVIMPSSSTIATLRKFVCAKHDVVYSDQAVLLHSNTLVKDDYQLGYFLRFGLMEGDTVDLKYFFANFPRKYDALSREASIRKMIHRRPLNVAATATASPIPAPAVPPKQEIVETVSPPQYLDARPTSVIVSPIRVASAPIVDPTQTTRSQLPPTVIVSRVKKPVIKKRRIEEKEVVANKILSALLLQEEDSRDMEPEMDSFFADPSMTVSSTIKRSKYNERNDSPYGYQEPYPTPFLDDKSRIFDSPMLKNESSPEHTVPSDSCYSWGLEDHNYAKSPDADSEKMVSRTGLSHPRVIFKPPKVMYIDLTCES